MVPTFRALSPSRGTQTKVLRDLKRSSNILQNIYYWNLRVYMIYCKRIKRTKDEAPTGQERYLQLKTLIGKTMHGKGKRAQTNEKQGTKNSEWAFGQYWILRIHNWTKAFSECLVPSVSLVRARLLFFMHDFPIKIFSWTQRPVGSSFVCLTRLRHVKISWRNPLSVLRHTSLI